MASSLRLALPKRLREGAVALFIVLSAIQLFISRKDANIFQKAQRNSAHRKSFAP
jgi:hypothetical protein